jgi:hypothetical protein
MYQLRVSAKEKLRVEDSRHYVWQVVKLEEPSRPVLELPPAFPQVLEENSHPNLTVAVEQGLAAFKRITSRPEGPVRHEWECSCGAQLVIEAVRSKRSPYSWDSPREIMCNCGRVFGVKLNFAANIGVPSIEALYRTMIR